MAFFFSFVSYSKGTSAKAQIIDPALFRAHSGSISLRLLLYWAGRGPKVLHATFCRHVESFFTAGTRRPFVSQAPRKHVSGVPWTFDVSFHGLVSPPSSSFF